MLISAPDIPRHTLPFCVPSIISFIMDIAVFIGPEGGFDESEIEALSQADGQIITLGNRILRTETAGMMLMSVLMYYYELLDLKEE